MVHDRPIVAVDLIISNGRLSDLASSRLSADAICDFVLVALPATQLSNSW